MTSDPAHIPLYVLASTLVLSGVILLCVQGNARPPGLVAVLAVGAAISIVGILFAKFGANAGLPWWIYYTVPVLSTVLVPPVVFRMGWRRSLIYAALAFATAPLIHLAFVKIVGWTDYMPFLKLD